METVSFVDSCQVPSLVQVTGYYCLPVSGLLGQSSCFCTYSNLILYLVTCCFRSHAVETVMVLRANCGAVELAQVAMIANATVAVVSTDCTGALGDHRGP